MAAGETPVFQRNERAKSFGCRTAGLRLIAQRRQPVKPDGKIKGFGVAALSALPID